MESLVGRAQAIDSTAICSDPDYLIFVLSHTPGDPYSLPVNSILYLCADTNHNMWAGSVRGGLISIKEVGMKI